MIQVVPFGQPVPVNNRHEDILIYTINLEASIALSIDILEGLPIVRNIWLCDVKYYSILYFSKISDSSLLLSITSLVLSLKLSNWVFLIK